jgi:hypothetical protein
MYATAGSTIGCGPPPRLASAGTGMLGGDAGRLLGATAFVVAHAAPKRTAMAARGFIIT